MNLAPYGIDVGYNAVKAVSEGKRKLIPSVTAAPIGKVFTNTGLKEVDAIDIEGIGKFSFGDAVIEQANVRVRREDRRWYESDTYKVLLLASISELTDGDANIFLTTGLPVSFYESDAAKLADTIAGRHEIQRVGRNPQTIEIDRDNIRVVPQPYGTLFSEAYNEDGDLHTKGSEIMQSKIGIIDIGGRTTNFQVTSKMTQLRAQADSIDAGGWKVVQAVKTLITGLCPEFKELADHTIAKAVKDKSIIYYGETVDLSEGVDEAVGALANAIAAKATTLWESGAELEQILITGGGAHLLGDLLAELYPHPALKIVSDPIYGNAIGYYKNSVRQSKN